MPRCSAPREWESVLGEKPKLHGCHNLFFFLYYNDAKRSKIFQRQISEDLYVLNGKYRHRRHVLTHHTFSHFWQFSLENAWKKVTKGRHDSERKGSAVQKDAKRKILAWCCSKPRECESVFRGETTITQPA